MPTRSGVHRSRALRGGFRRRADRRQRGGRSAGGSLSPPPSGGPTAQPQSRPNPKRAAPHAKTTGRSELSRNPRFAEISPEVGVLDEAALQKALTDNPDEALALLANLVHATDEKLRNAARMLAGRLLIDRARVGKPHARGTGRLRLVSAERGGDLDIDTSMEAIVSSHAEGRLPALDELTARDWARPELALCLVVDTSGSMNGERLAAAALTAAACAWRAPTEHAILTFAREVSRLRPISSTLPPSAVVDEVLSLRGHGVTGLAGALRAASDELAGARASRRVVILLSDCRATDDEDPLPAAARIPELLILAPADDTDQASQLASAAGARWSGLRGAADAPRALAELLT